jgi:toxin FitB
VSFLIDTNVISEWLKPRPEPRVVAWLAGVDEDRVHISTVTVGELRYGVERLAHGARRKRLDEWLHHDLPLRFEGRILPIDLPVAHAWGSITARRERAGRPISPIDAFIAATAEVHDLTLVTRDVAEFASAARSVLNPWAADFDGQEG